jgi:hypothetical protein
VTKPSRSDASLGAQRGNGAPWTPEWPVLDAKASRRPGGCGRSVRWRSPRALAKPNPTRSDPLNMAGGLLHMLDLVSMDGFG